MPSSSGSKLSASLTNKLKSPPVSGDFLWILALGSNFDSLAEYGYFLYRLSSQTFLDALAAKRIDALLYLQAQLHTDLGCQASVTLYLSEREGAVGMLFK